METDPGKLKLALAQIAPVWLDKKATFDKILKYSVKAASRRTDLLVFGEALLPGYPFWLSLTNGAAFNSPMQKELYAHYVRNAVNIDEGDLEELCNIAKKNRMAVYLGTVERAADRGGHSLYCSLVFIGQNGEIASVHRKLQPTYEERLVWASGDGKGLVVHPLGLFKAGGLNCWENWMPLSRTALYGQGEDLHIAVWPGSVRNTKNITRFIAEESRSYVVSVSALMRKSDIPESVPYRDKILENAPEIMADGGSCIAAPDGTWVVEPVAGHEGLIFAEIDYNRVLEERQNFDPAGHYARPDVTRLIVNRERQTPVKFDDHLPGK